MSESAPLILTRLEYLAMDAFHQAVADVAARKGRVKIVENEEAPNRRGNPTKEGERASTHSPDAQTECTRSCEVGVITCRTQI